MKVALNDALVSSDDRSKHVASLARHRHIFLDPDTGIKIEPFKGAKPVNYVFGPELVELCKQLSECLLLVFDQSVPRGSERTHIAKKLSYFRQRNIFGFAYVSHACFVVLSQSESSCQAAREQLLKSHLPQSRLVDADEACEANASFDGLTARNDLKHHMARR